MSTFHDFSDLGELLRVLPARLRLVADYVSREDALEREAAAELLDECAARLEAQRDRLARCNADVLHALGCGCLEVIPGEEEFHTYPLKQYHLQKSFIDIFPDTCNFLKN